MRCGNCNNTTGEILFSHPAKVKCTIDNQNHFVNDTCDYDYLVECKSGARECEICGNEHYEINRTICPECRERLKRLLYDED